MSFSIITDSCANLTNKLISDYDVKIVSLTIASAESSTLATLRAKSLIIKSFTPCFVQRSILKPRWLATSVLKML